MSEIQTRVLVLFAHPALQKSRVNRRLAVEPQALDGVTFHDLYEAYPRFDIDVPREQDMLLQHDYVLLQHPFYWYSTPSILKEWQDLVLQHGWAYGSEGTALHGKKMLNVISTGGREEAYCAQGYNRHSMLQLLAPLEQTARLCGMRYLPPFVVHGTHAMDEEEIDGHAVDYRRLLEAIRADRIDLDATADLPRINLELDRVITAPVEG